MTSEGMNVYSPVQGPLTIEINLTLASCRDANVRRILTFSTNGEVSGLGLRV